ncbi:NUDIX domain-containing protein [Balneola vulgaris]|uniref:NUDIX domain-containing protein n=1 Tax=Balneola vulgaris TaxID=287535 RepID=UPI00037B80D8|nr:NUDIX hydrolase [Balneola vulgaris]
MIDTSLLLEEKITSKAVYKGKLLHVYQDKVSLPNGDSSLREWIKHPGACAIVPIYENGDILMLHQFRYAAQQVFMEVPAGKIDTGESILETATRELKEETGLEAEKLEYIGHFYPAIGYANEVIHIYAATGLHQSESDRDEDEFLELFRIPFKEAIDKVYTGEINDAKTMACLLRTWKWWNT